MLEEQFIEPPRTLRVRALIAGVIGLVLGAAIALAMDRVDDKVRTRRDAQEAFGLPVVAEVPKIPASVRRRGMVVLVRPASYGAEAHRILRMGLQLMPRWVLPQRVTAASGEEPGAVVHEAVSIEGPTKVVLVTSAEPGEGKTTTAANLAATFGELGKVVIALDCDFRHPTLHTPFGLDDPGMNDVAHDGGAAALSAGLVATSLPNVMLLRGGTESEPGSQGADSAIELARGVADVVVVDSGPILNVNDALALVPQVDAVIVVARSGRTTVAAARRTIELLGRVEAPILGVVLTAVPRALLSERPSGRYYQGPQAKSAPKTGKSAPKKGKSPERRPPSAWTVPQQTATTGD